MATFAIVVNLESKHSSSKYPTPRCVFLLLLQLAGGPCHKQLREPLLTIHWYLVKRNWQQTSNYAGVGGHIWPLDPLAGTTDAAAAKIHRDLMAARVDVELEREYWEPLCLNRALAEAYWTELNRRTGDAWLLEVSLGEGACESANGFDFGFASGGGSLVESELITQGRNGPTLNEWGLLGSQQDAWSFFEARAGEDDLEDADAVELLAVTVLRHGRR